MYVKKVIFSCRNNRNIFKAKENQEVNLFFLFFFNFEKSGLFLMSIFLPALEEIQLIELKKNISIQEKRTVADLGQNV